MASVLFVPQTGSADLDGLLTGTKWSVSTLTYSFPTSGSFYETSYSWDGEPLDNFEALNSVQQAAARTALGFYAGATNLSFSEVTESASVHADIRLAESDAPSTGWAYYPSAHPTGGDVWLNNSKNWYDAPVKGNYAYYTIVHELGHALGLEHPHETYDADLAPAAHDSMEYSVMSYRSYVGQADGGYTNESGGYAQSPMMYDIAALQHLYGANFGTNATNTTYTWNPGTGELSIDGAGQGAPVANRVFMTLWDGGGVDTYDFSNYTSAVTADLRPGSWTTMSQAQRAYLGSGHYAEGNVANALLYHDDVRSLIENIRGGSAGDVLIGNRANNTLDGNAGADTMRGGAGDDTYVVDTSGDAVVENANGGIDSVRSSASYTLAANVEHLALLGSSALNASGNALANTLTGNAGDNSLDGGGGNDTIYGRDGNDTVLDSAGVDFVYGDADTDTLDFSGAASGVATMLTINKAWDVQTDEPLAYMWDVEDVVGSAYGDYLAADDGSNRVYGGAGNDALIGLGGDDTLDGGAGTDTLSGGNGSDRIFDTAGLDYVYGDAGTDTLDFSRATAGVAAMMTIYKAWDLLSDDILAYAWGIEDFVGSPERDYLAGDGEANRIQGGGGNDTLIGNGGNDTLEGGAGGDALSGGAGNDVLFDDAGLEYVWGGAGVDTLDFSREAFGVATMLTINKAWHIVTDDTLAYFWEVEQVVGTDQGDWLAGDSGANAIYGGEGNDALLGEGGDDTLDGGAGNDRLRGGAGNDTVYGGAGDDTIFDGAGVDYADGGSGTDTLDFSGADAGVAVMLAIAKSWDIATDETLVRSSSIENLVGSTYADYLAGDASANRLNGGAGSDRLIGGAGSDVFDFDRLADGRDKISDFTPGAGGDKLDLKDLLAGYDAGTSVLSDFVQLTISGADTIVSVNADGVGSDFVEMAVLNNLTGLMLNDMLGQGNLIVA